jgi:hypothetical protein
MSPEISERAFEEAIECALLEHGPDACIADVSMVRETSPAYGETPPGLPAELSAQPGGYRKRRPKTTTGRSVSCRAT